MQEEIEELKGKLQVCKNTIFMCQDYYWILIRISCFFFLQEKEKELEDSEEKRKDLRLQVREEAIKNVRLDKVSYRYPQIFCKYIELYWCDPKI